MGLKKLLEEKEGQIEKGLIALIFVWVVLSLFTSEILRYYSLVLTILEVLLVGFYFIQLQVKPYAFLWTCFLVGLIAYFFPGISAMIEFSLFSLGFLVFGIIIIAKSIKMSIQNKSFELLTFISGFILTLMILIPYTGVKEMFNFYFFALTASIGIIIYNDNLWHRYYQDEKNVFKYILVIGLTMVLQSSSKYLNF